MNSGTLKEILKVNFLSFTKEEIESIMNEELEKAPEEMDTELIDMCLDILTGEPVNKADEKLTVSPAVSENKVKKIKFKKGILVAAIIMLLISIAIPVGASIFDIDVPENILKVYEEHFKLDTEGESQSEDLTELLDKNNLSELVLPQFLYEECEISDFEIVSQDLITRVYFKYYDKEQDISGSVNLNMFENEANFFNGDMLVNSQYDEAKQITINGIEVIVFCENKDCFIIYCANESEYNIELSGISFDKAIKIASTL